MGSTSTPNLGLFKAVIGTAEPFRGGLDVNSNMDKIDTAVGSPYSDVTQATANNTAVETQLLASTIGPPLQGSIWKLEACGGFGHQAVATTITFRVKLGGAALTYTVSTPATLLTGRLWRLDISVYCLTLGGSGTWKLFGLGVATIGSTDTPTLLSTTVTKDTSVPQTLEVTGQWGTANAANTLSCETGFIRRVTNA